MSKKYYDIASKHWRVPSDFGGASRGVSVPQNLWHEVIVENQTWKLFGLAKIILSKFSPW